MSETAEQARTRRRWIGLAEIVAVVGLLIAGTTLYLQWQDRREDKAAAARAAAAAHHSAGIATLTGTVAKGGDAIALADPAHVVSGVTVTFPTALGLASQEAMPGPEVDASWFAAAVLKLTDGTRDRETGRLPVLVTTNWFDGDTRRQDSAIYDILWRTEGRFLQGRALKLTGWALAERSTSLAALDARWAKLKPKAATASK